MRGAIVLLALLLLVWQASTFQAFLADDALISLRYSQRLVQGLGLTWTDGPRVEGYSNLLWVLLNALLGWSGLDLVVAARLLGLVGMAAAILAVAYRSFAHRTVWPLAIGLLVFVLSAPVAAYVMGGMEQPLIAGLWAWALVFTHPVLESREVSTAKALLPGLFLGLLCLTRPDSPLFIATTLLALWIVRGIRQDTVRITLRLLALPALFILGQLIFRLAYYGEWVPNTALVKISPSANHLLAGFKYVVKGSLALSPFLPLSILGGLLMLLRKPTRPRAILHLAAIFAWMGYLVFIGGDIFPAWRHFVPLIVLMTLLLADGAQALEDAQLPERLRRMAPVGAAAAAAVLIGGYAWVQAANPENQRANQERWIFDGLYVGQMLKTGFSAMQPVIAVEPAGCVPYASELPAIDMLGLNDYYIPRHPPADFGQGWIGHELGDGAYVFDRNPDLVLFCLPSGNFRGCYRSGKEMMTHPGFFERYTFSEFSVQAPYSITSKIWVNKDSPRIGIQRADRRVIVPSYFLNGNADSVAYLNAAGRFVVAVSPDRFARINGLRLPSGAWQVSVENGARLLLTLYASGEQSTMVSDAPLPASITVRPDDLKPVDVVLTVRGGAAVEITNLVFSRAP